LKKKGANVMESTLHYFDKELATKYGVVEAIILNNFRYWIQKNTEENKNYHDGKYWTFNSVQSFCKLFPYLTAKKIRNAIKRLEDAKILLKGNFNKMKYDRTTWYTFTELGLRLFPCFQKTEQQEQSELKTEQEEQPELKTEQKVEERKEPAEQNNTVSQKNSTKKNTMQVPPTMQEVQAYCTERNSCISVKRFVAYYTANGWYFGRKKMKKTKDWQAAVRYWEETEKPVANFGSQGKTTQNRNRFCNYTQREWDFAEIERLEQELQNNGGW